METIRNAIPSIPRFLEEIRRNPSMKLGSCTARHYSYMHIVSTSMYVYTFPILHSGYPSKVAKIRSSLWNSFTIQVYD